MKTKIIALIVLAAVFVTLGAGVAGFFIWEKSHNQDDSTPVLTPDNLEVIPEDGEHVKILSVTPMSMTKGATGISKEIKAIVIPDEAKNKQVDWSISWLDETISLDISEFLTITPESDGSTKATVTCIEPFTEDAVITVTTRENGYTASCIVRFVGLPTTIVISSKAAQNVDGMYHVPISANLDFTARLNNPFNLVSDDYKELEVTIEGVGTINVGTKYVTVQSGATTWHEESIQSLSLNDIKDSFISATVSGITITFTTTKTIESFYGSFKMIDGGRTREYTNAFHSFNADSPAYFKITVKEVNCGLKRVFNVVLDANVVQGVETNMDELLF